MKQQYHDKNWLYNEYYVNRKSMNQIAKERKVSQSTINKFFHKFGFTIDTLTSYGWSKGLTKKNDSRIKKMADSSIGRKVWNKGVTKKENSNLRGSYTSYKKGRKISQLEILKREETKRRIREQNSTYGLNLKNNRIVGSKKYIKNLVPTKCEWYRFPGQKNKLQGTFELRFAFVLDRIFSGKWEAHPNVNISYTDIEGKGRLYKPDFAVRINGETTYFDTKNKYLLSLEKERFKFKQLVKQGILVQLINEELLKSFEKTPKVWL